MYESRFSDWRHWVERNEHADVSRPGVYVIALRKESLSGKPFTWCPDVIYVGMTNAVSGLRGRLRKFDYAMSEPKRRGHGGADRAKFKHPNYAAFCERAYVAIAPFKCDPASNLPHDLKCMGDVARFEYLCLAHFVEQFGRLPEFNDKEHAPKYSRTHGTSG